MGTVYEGENIRIERRVAIKVLHEHVASSPEFAERFEREARASARVGSEHVCDVLDLGDLPNGERYLVMEFLDGESLEDRLDRSTFTAAELAPDVDEAFAAIVKRGLSRDPEQRFPSARAYQEEIVAWGRSKGDPRLLFNITLSDRPPPLATLSGGYPV